MSQPSSARNAVLIALGAVIVVATYLYLVLGRPADVAESSTSQASLIAIAGYVIGAVLLAAGSIHRLPTATVAMVPVAIALNIVVGQIVAVLGLPVYLDSIGTVLVSALAGPAAGVVTGILTNVIWGLTLSPIALPFAVVQVVIGVMAGYGARFGIFRRICESAGVPVQYYANRADMPGGSTLGNISNTQVSLNAVDIGLAQLAMHSPFETAGAADTASLVKALTAFFEHSLVAERDGVYRFL